MRNLDREEEKHQAPNKRADSPCALPYRSTGAFFILICVASQNARDGAGSLEHVSISNAASLQARPISRNPLRCSSVLARAAQRTLSRAY
jgi:hypothetical protein